MKNNQTQNQLLRSGTFAVLLLVSVSFLDAGIRERSGSYQGARGQSGDWGSKVERGQGFRTIERNGSGERGNWSSQRQSTWDRLSGTGNSA